MKPNIIAHYILAHLLGTVHGAQVEAFLESPGAVEAIAFLQAGFLPELKLLEAHDYAGFWAGLPADVKTALTKEVGKVAHIAAPFTPADQEAAFAEGLKGSPITLDKSAA